MCVYVYLILEKEIDDIDGFLKKHKMEVELPKILYTVDDIKKLISEKEKVGLSDIEFIPDSVEIYDYYDGESYIFEVQHNT